jgi:hypothetical protein
MTYHTRPHSLFMMLDDAGTADLANGQRNPTPTPHLVSLLFQNLVSFRCFVSLSLHFQIRVAPFDL